MSKITKKDLKKQLDVVQNRFAALVKDLKASGYVCESVYAPFAHDYQKEQSDHDALIDILDSKEPQLKQLDQSIFNGLDEKWRFAAVDLSGEAWVYREQPKIDKGDDRWSPSNTPPNSIGTGYDTTNWQNSLIERDTAKELLEVDLSSELTGSELCKAMLKRGDKIVLCIVRDYEHEDDTYYDAITHCSGDCFESSLSTWRCAVPINNQGEPLTAAEVGL